MCGSAEHNGVEQVSETFDWAQLRLKDATMRSQPSNRRAGEDCAAGKVLCMIFAAIVAVGLVQWRNQLKEAELQRYNQQQQEPEYEPATWR